jgi:hypothetical protein
MVHDFRSNACRPWGLNLRGTFTSRADHQSKIFVRRWSVVELNCRKGLKDCVKLCNVLFLAFITDSVLSNPSWCGSRLHGIYAICDICVCSDDWDMITPSFGLVRDVPQQRILLGRTIRVMHSPNVTNATRRRATFTQMIAWRKKHKYFRIISRDRSYIPTLKSNNVEGRPVWPRVTYLSNFFETKIHHNLSISNTETSIDNLKRNKIIFGGIMALHFVHRDRFQ